MRPFMRWSAWLCLLLILWSAAVVVAHHHDGAESAQCSVCAAFHAAAPAPQITLARATFVAVSSVTPAAEIAAKQRLAIFALTVRPPPQA
jgi:hypothetical protein